MKPGDVVVSALAEWNGKALKKAEKDVGVFDKSVKSLAKTFAGVFAASKLLSYSKNAVAAFAADEKAAKSLEVQLSNLGYSFSAPGVELYIANLQKMYGVLDDQLRPAFQTLITASGSLTQSQKALDVALNVSAATGRSVEEVSAALAKGFSGQTTALSRLGAGLDKATLASGDMNKIMDALNAKFAGQAAARLDTYAGKMDALKVASANASEIIGQSLVKSLEALSGSDGIQRVTSDMENLAKEIGVVIEAVGNLAALLRGPTIGGRSLLGQILFPAGSPSEALGKIDARFNKPKSSAFTYSLGTNAQNEIAAAQARLAELKNLKERNRVNAQLLAQEKAKLALNDLAKKFDTERLGLQLALNNASDEETKLRIKAKIALLDQDSAMASVYNKQLEAAAALNALNAATSKLTLQFGASVTDIQKYLAAQQTNYNQYIATGTSPSTAPDATTQQVVNDYLKDQVEQVAEQTASFLEKLRTKVKAGYDIPGYDEFYSAFPSYKPSNTNGSTGATPEVTVNVSAAGSIIGLEELDAAIQDSLLRIYRQNGDLMPAGFLP